MVKPGIIYHKNTRGIEGFFTEEEMAKSGILKTPFCHAIHYGTSVFEGIRAIPDKNTKELYIMTFDKHINRFMNSMEYLVLTKPKDMGKVAEDLKFSHLDEMLRRGIKIEKPNPETLKFLNMTEEGISYAIMENIRRNIRAGSYKAEDGCYIRPIAYRDDKFDEEGNHGPSLGVFSLNHDVVFEIESFYWGSYVDTPKTAVYPEGVDTPLRHVKAGANYGFGGRTKNWAKINGFDEAILTDTAQERNVLEGSGENIFVFTKYGEILTPHMSQSILPGTKRNLVIQIAKNLGMKVTERKIPLEEFFDAGAAAFSGTATGFEPISCVYDPKTNKFKVFNLKCPQMQELVEEYKNLLTGDKVHEVNEELQRESRTKVAIY